MRFQHPLVRSAVYRRADLAERRRAHATLAVVTDAVTDPDRRAWHLAAAAVGPDEVLAVELTGAPTGRSRVAELAAAAAFRRRAAWLTLDPTARVDRRSPPPRSPGTPEISTAPSSSSVAWEATTPHWRPLDDCGCGDRSLWDGSEARTRSRTWWRPPSSSRNEILSGHG